MEGRDTTTAAGPVGTIRRMAMTTPGEVARLAGRLPGGMTPERGEQIHEFIRTHRPESCLELGFANGVGALYIGSALEANGCGTLTSVDRRRARNRHPSAGDLLESAGLSGRVTLVYEETSYVWFLHDTLRSQLNAGGEVEPCYDFVFLDGAHTWDVDALAFTLADRLLRPGGWMLFDDLDWRLDERWRKVPEHQRSFAQVTEIWELLVLTHPAYDAFRSDGQWGWARKSIADRPPTRLLVKHDLVGGARSLARLGRARLRGSRVVRGSRSPSEGHRAPPS
jgi:predicted O-methyltransferase YrrM